MTSSLNLLATESMKSIMTCNVDECLSFIIVFLNLLTIFYLVYSSYKKVTKLTRIFGYIWSSFIMCASVVVLALHTCIFTIAGTVFTGMAIIAVLSMIFESKKSENASQPEIQNKQKNWGSYVIFPTDDNRFVFGLYTANREKLLMSVYKYDSLEQVKIAIATAREYGVIANIEDSTKNWILDVNHPKFRMYLAKEGYLVDLAIDYDYKILKSEGFASSENAEKIAKLAMKAVGSTILYFAEDDKEVKFGKDYILYKSRLEEYQDSDREEDIEESKELDENKSQEVEINTDDDFVESTTLSQSLATIKDLKGELNITKLSLCEHFNKKYSNKVIINHRDNYTRTGLPLADTYFTFTKVSNNGGRKSEKKKVCYAYVYESDGGVLLLVRLSKNDALEIKGIHNNINLSRFPKSQMNDWYSIVIDETFNKEDDVYKLLDKAKKYCE